MNNSISLKAWLIWLSASIFYLYEFVLRASPGVIAHDLMRDFNVTAGALGILTSSYYYAYAPLQIPCGLIVDKLGPRKIITFSALLCVIGSVIFAYSESMLQAQFGRFLIGAGSACAFISCIKLGAEWFPPSKIAIVAGITNAMGTLGGTFAGYPFAILANDLGWRTAMIVCAAIGILVSLGAWIMISDHSEHQAKRNNKQERSASVFAILKDLVKDKQFALISIYACFTYVPVSVFCELWAVPFMIKIYDIDNAMASKANITLYIGTAIGSIILANLSDFLKSRKKVMIFSTFLVCMLFIFIIFFNHYISLNLMYGLFFLIGCFSGAQVISFACINELYPSRVSGASSGFMNAIVTVGPMTLQPLFGIVLDSVWNGRMMENGLPDYTIANYQVSMVILLSLLVISIVSISCAKETFGHNARLRNELY